jgi:hypothetical protein
VAYRHVIYLAGKNLSPAANLYLTITSCFYSLLFLGYIHLLLHLVSNTGSRIRALLSYISSYESSELSSPSRSPLPLLSLLPMLPSLPDKAYPHVLEQARRPSSIIYSTLQSFHFFESTKEPSTVVNNIVCWFLQLIQWSFGQSAIAHIHTSCSSSSINFRLTTPPPFIGMFLS